MPTPPSPRQAALGRAFREVRRELGLSQEEVAARAGTNLHQVGRLERGSRDIKLSTLVKLIDGLGVPLSEIVRRYEDG